MLNLQQIKSKIESQIKLLSNLSGEEFEQQFNYCQNLFKTQEKLEQIAISQDKQGQRIEKQQQVFQSSQNQPNSSQIKEKQQLNDNQCLIPQNQNQNNEQEIFVQKNQAENSSQRPYFYKPEELQKIEQEKFQKQSQLNIQNKMYSIIQFGKNNNTIGFDEKNCNLKDNQNSHPSQSVLSEKKLVQSPYKPQNQQNSKNQSNQIGHELIQEDNILNQRRLEQYLIEFRLNKQFFFKKSKSNQKLTLGNLNSKRRIENLNHEEYPDDFQLLESCNKKRIVNEEGLFQNDSMKKDKKIVIFDRKNNFNIFDNYPSKRDEYQNEIIPNKLNLEREPYSSKNQDGLFYEARNQNQKINFYDQNNRGRNVVFFDRNKNINIFNNKALNDVSQSERSPHNYNKIQQQNNFNKEEQRQQNGDKNSQQYQNQFNSNQIDIIGNNLQKKNITFYNKTSNLNIFDKNDYLQKDIGQELNPPKLNSQGEENDQNNYGYRLQQNDCQIQNFQKNDLFSEKPFYKKRSSEKNIVLFNKDDNFNIFNNNQNKNIQQYQQISSDKYENKQDIMQQQLEHDQNQSQKKPFQDIMNEKIIMDVSNQDLQTQKEEEDKNVVKLTRQLNDQVIIINQPIEELEKQGFQKNRLCSIFYLKYILNPSSEIKKDVFSKENKLIKMKKEKGIEIHRYVANLFRNNQNMLKSCNSLTEDQQNFLKHYVRVVQDYITIRGMKVTGVEQEFSSEGEKKRYDMVAENEKEALIFDWKFTGQDVYYKILVDYQEHFMNQIRVLQQIYTGKIVRICILPLQVIKQINFVEFEYKDIQEIQLNQAKDSTFQKSMLKIFFDNIKHEPKTKDEYVYSNQGSNITIQQLVDKLIQEEDLKQIEYYLDLNNSDDLLFKQQKKDSYEKIINKKQFNQFYYIHILLCQRLSQNNSIQFNESIRSRINKTLQDINCYNPINNQEVISNQMQSLPSPQYSPNSFKQLSNSYQQSPESFNRSPQSFQQYPYQIPQQYQQYPPQFSPIIQQNPQQSNQINYNKNYLQLPNQNFFSGFNQQTKPQGHQKFNNSYSPKKY